MGDAVFTPTAASVRFTDTDDDVSFIATGARVTFTAGPIIASGSGGGGGSPTGGAGGFLSGTYPNPGVNTEALQDAVGAMAGTGLTYNDTAGTLNTSDLVVSAGTAPTGPLFRFHNFARNANGTIHNATTNGTAIGDPGTWVDGRTASGEGLDSLLEVAQVVGGVLRHRGTRLVAAASMELEPDVWTLSTSVEPALAGPGGGYEGWVDEGSYHAVRLGLIDSSSNGYVGYIERGVEAGSSLGNHRAVIVRDDFGVPSAIAGPVDLGRVLTSTDTFTFTHDGDGVYVVLVNGVEAVRLTDTTHDPAGFQSAAIVLNSHSLWRPGCSWFAMHRGTPLRDAAGGGSGDVVGPASSVNGRVALFDGTTGKLLKQSSAAPVLEGDSRLTDSRTPTAHTHAAADVTTGTFDAARIPDLAASKITSGVFPIARLATGTPDGTKFVRDDGTLAVPAGGSSGPFGGASSYGGNRAYMLPGVIWDSLANAIALGADIIRYVPFLIRAGTLSVDRIHFEVTTLQASSTTRVGVYAADGSWQPTGAALIDATASSATTGSKNITVSATLAPGRYLACMVANANVSVRAGAARQTWGSDHDATRVTAANAAQMISNRRVSLVYPASLPNPAPAWTLADYTSTNAVGDPVILLRGTFS